MNVRDAAGATPGSLDALREPLLVLAAAHAVDNHRDLSTLYGVRRLQGVEVFGLSVQPKPAITIAQQTFTHFQIRFSARHAHRIRHDGARAAQLLCGRARCARDVERARLEAVLGAHWPR